MRALAVVTAALVATSAGAEPAPGTHRIAFINVGDAAPNAVNVAAFKQGQNLTGLAVLAGDLDAKRLELLTQIVPQAKRIAMIWNPAQQRIDGIIRNVDDVVVNRSAARELGIKIPPVVLQRADDVLP